MIDEILKGLAKPLAEGLSRIQAKKMISELSPEFSEGLDLEAKQQEFIDSAKGSMETALGPGIKDLTSKLVLLTTGAIDFATRLATVPLAIISVTPSGPGVSVNLILPLIKELQGEARNLSKTYDETKSTVEALKIPELAEENGAINTIYKAIQAELVTVKTMILLVGVKCDGDEGGDTSAYEKSPIEPEPYSADDCVNFEAKDDPGSDVRIAKNCKNFAYIGGRGRIEQSDITCSNCTHFKK